MKKNYTHISIVLDRSGSMSSMAGGVEEGFKQFIEDQKKQEGEATISLAQFDDIYEIVHNFINIKDVNGLNLKPRGSTALLDAMGTTLEETRAKVMSMGDDQPAKVIFVFITDGGENASSKYSRKQIFEMIKDLKNVENVENNINWEFVFIGANQDAISEGGSYGISARSSMTFAASSDGASTAWCSLSKGISAYRCCSDSNASYSFDEKDRKEQDALLNKSSTISRKNNKYGPIPQYIKDLDDGLVIANNTTDNVKST